MDAGLACRRLQRQGHGRSRAPRGSLGPRPTRAGGLSGLAAGGSPGPGSGPAGVARPRRALEGTALPGADRPWVGHVPCKNMNLGEQKCVTWAQHECS